MLLAARCKSDCLFRRLKGKKPSDFPPKQQKSTPPEWGRASRLENPREGVSSELPARAGQDYVGILVGGRGCVAVRVVTVGQIGFDVETVDFLNRSHTPGL